MGDTFWGYVGEILLSYYPLIHLGLRASGGRCLSSVLEGRGAIC